MGITQVHNYEDTINTQNITAENTIEEIIVPVVTHNTQAHQESNQYVIIKSEVNTEGPYKMKNSLNDEWATESMFPELQEGSQNSEDPFQAHNPSEITGQVLPPEDANVIDENPFTASGEMDLLATVLNDEIDVNSEEFQNFIALENEPDTEMSTINFEDIMGTPSTSGIGSPASGCPVEIKEEPMEATGVFI